MNIKKAIASVTVSASLVLPIGAIAACHTKSAPKLCAEHKASTEIVVIAYSGQNSAYCRYARTYDSTVQRCAWIRFSDHHVSQDPFCTGV